MDNCLTESYIQKIEEACNCSHTTASEKPKRVCTGKDYECEIHNHIRYGHKTTIKSRNEHLHCYSNCNDQEFSTAVSTATYNIMSNFRFHHGIEFCQVFKKILRSCRKYKKFALNEFYPGLCNNFKKYQEDHFKCVSFHEFKVIVMLQRITNKFRK